MKLLQTTSMLLVLCAVSLGAQDRSEWFEFYLPWNDSTESITNVSRTLDPPAGKHGFLEVTPDGHFKFENATDPIRFAGVVNVASSNFPDKTTARALAARMAKFGINLVRIHLVDVDWSNGLFANSRDNTLQLSADRLDRMDYYIYCLKEKGIYFNFCIHAGREYKVNDGIDAPVQNRQSKYVTLFDPEIIELQKDFAHKTLGHQNPYTGLTYAEDPAMANVELTNENQLYNGWFGWQSDYIFAETEEGIGPYYSAELDTLFNEWLVGRYPDTDSLSIAWSGSAGETEEMVLNQSFESGLESWRTYIRDADGAVATIEADQGTAAHGNGSAHILVESAGTAGWHVQMKTNDMKVEDKLGYKLAFYAKSDVPSEFAAEVMENTTWRWVGAPKFSAGSEWQLFEYYFVAPFSSEKLIIQFDFGLATGNYWLDSVSVSKYGGEGLEDGESLELANVQRVPHSRIGKYSANRIADNARFYFHLEGRYIATMTDYLKNELGVKVPVTFTNNYFGLASIYSQSRAEYIDMHGYWDHPSFPNGHSETDFTMQNRPMVKNPAVSTVNRMSLSRVEGLPLVLSEYNHPYPQIYQSEAPSILYAYGSLLDLDGIEWHAYNDFKQNYTQRYQDMFFDIAMHPVVMSQHLLSVPYRQGRIKPAGNKVFASYNDQEVFRGTKIYQDDDVINIDDADYGTSFLADGFAHRTFEVDSSYLEGKFSQKDQNYAASEGEELTWDGEKGIVRVNNPYWQGATGFLGGEVIACDDITLSNFITTNGKNFGYVHLISMDSLPINQSKHLVLLTGARLENEGFRWNDAQTTPALLGGTRALCEPVHGRLKLNFASRDSFYVYRLDERGHRSDLVFDSDTAGMWEVEFGHHTLWYEILNDSAVAVEIPVDTTTNDTTETDTTSIESYRLGMYSFPNPCQHTLAINLSSEVPREGALSILNTLGVPLISRKVNLPGNGNAIYRFNVSRLSDGIYFYRFATAMGQPQIKKFLKTTHLSP